MIVKFAEIKQPVIGVMSSFTRVHLAPLNSSTINWPIKAWCILCTQPLISLLISHSLMSPP